MLNDLGNPRTPQPLQSWLVYAGGTATTRRPAHAALASRMRTELRPARIADALGEVMVPDHIGDPQIFEIDRVVLAHEIQRGLVVEVGALALQRLMRPLEVAHRFAPALAAFLAARDTLIGLGELLFTPAVVARVLDRFPVSGERPSSPRLCRSHVRWAARVAPGQPGHRRTTMMAYQPSASWEIVTVLGVPCQRAAPTHRDAAPDLGEREALHCRAARRSSYCG